MTSLAAPASLPAALVAPAAWLALASAVAGVLLLCSGDPYGLALPCSLLGATLGGAALRFDGPPAPAHVALNLGILILFLWFAFEAVGRGLLGIDLLTVPAVTPG